MLHAGLAVGSVARLDPHDALLVIADGGPLASFAGCRWPWHETSRSIHGHELEIELTRQIGQRLDRVSLQFLLAGAPLTLADDARRRRSSSLCRRYVRLPGGCVSRVARPPAAARDDGRGARGAGGHVVRHARAMGPLADLRQATADLAGGHFARRVRTDGPEEIAALATSFNAMATELERQQSLRRIWCTTWRTSFAAADGAALPSCNRPGRPGCRSSGGGLRTARAGAPPLAACR